MAPKLWRLLFGISLAALGARPAMATPCLGSWCSVSDSGRTMICCSLTSYAGTCVYGNCQVFYCDRSAMIDCPDVDIP